MTGHKNGKTGFSTAVLELNVECYLLVCCRELGKNGSQGWQSSRLGSLIDAVPLLPVGTVMLGYYIICTVLSSQHHTKNMQNIQTRTTNVYPMAS